MASKGRSGTEVGETVRATQEKVWEKRVCLGRMLVFV